MGTNLHKQAHSSSLTQPVFLPQHSYPPPTQNYLHTMHWLLSNALFSVAILSSVALAHCSFAEEVDPTRFEKVTIATGLVQPMQMANAPDGRIFLIELAGAVKLIDPVSKTATVIAKIPVTTEQENGLIGICLDPKFSENGWVYLQYSPPDFPGQQLSRFRFRNDTLDLASEQKLFRFEEQRRECCHHAGSMTFGPDGCLYLGTGDNTNPFNDSDGYAPLDQRPNRQPWDGLRTAGNTKNYNGKVLRIRPNPTEGYSIPDGNLFPKDGSIGHPEIYVMGCRNPWRISVDQRTGFLYWGDVGPDAGSDGPKGPKGYDEVNQARTAGNFGWPCFIGPNRPYNMFDFATGKIGEPQDPSHPYNHSINNTGAKDLPPIQPPFIYYPAGESKEFPEVGTGGRTACAGPVYYYDSTLKSENKFPESYDATLFAFEWSRSWIMAVHMDKDSKIQKLERFLPDVKITRPIHLEFDRQGRLYVIEYGETWGVNAEAALHRIEYVRGNRTPVAKAVVENNIGREPLKIRMKSEGSTDKDGDKLSFRWALTRTTGDDRKAKVISESANADATIDEPGSYTLSLEVRDPKGASDVATYPVVVGNARPEIKFLSPTDGDFYSPGEKITYSLQIDDVEDGTSDFDHAEARNLETIELTAPKRTFVQVSPLAADKSDGKPVPLGLDLMRKSDCFNCHAIDRALVGPKLVDVATKYRDVPGALEMSIKRVTEGSTGVWGKVAMLPHSQHSAEQVGEMVRYVYTLQADANSKTVGGLTNSIETTPDSNGIQMEAYYTDLGRDAIAPLTGSQTLRLRSRLMQAERADAILKAEVLNSGKAQGNAFVGSIQNGAVVRINRIPLSKVSNIVVRAASAGQGGRIEVRSGASDGPLLGKVDVEVNGDWEAFSEKPIALTSKEGTHDLFFVFKNANGGGGLMNIDTIEFRP